MYVVAKAFSYKSYMVTTKFQEFYPRYNKETPEFYKNLLRDYAESVKSAGEVYNPETFVLERENSHLKDYVAAITEQDLKNPHIKFFNERNPGWMKVCASIRKGEVGGVEGGRGEEGKKRRGGLEEGRGVGGRGRGKRKEGERGRGGKEGVCGKGEGREEGGKRVGQEREGK